MKSSESSGESSFDWWSMSEPGAVATGFIESEKAKG